METMQRDVRFFFLAIVAAISCGGRATYDRLLPPDASPSVATDPPGTAECLTGDVLATRESLSFDGRWFAFLQDGQAILLDRSTGTRAVLSRNLSDVGPPFISGDGNRVLFGAGGGTDIHAFVWDRTTNGMLATFFVGDGVFGALSHDGRFLTIHSRDPSFAESPLNPLGAAVVVDLSTNERWQASVNDGGEAANDYTRSSDLSDDGQRVVFWSAATNLVPGKHEYRFDLYLHDHATGNTVLAAPSMKGGYADSTTVNSVISGDGRLVAFESQASDLVPGDHAGTPDVFTWDIAENTVTSFTLGDSNEFPSFLRNVSRDGRLVLFTTDAGTYVADDRNDSKDAFVYDRARDRFELVTLARNGSPLEKGGSPIAMSGDGRVVAFETASPELAGDGGNSVKCFFVREP